MNKTNNKKFNIVPSGAAMKAVAAIFLLGVAAFVALTIKINILPVKYLILFLVIFIGITLGILVLLASRKSEVKRLTGLILAVIMLSIITVGAYYLISTNDTLSKISQLTGEVKTYDIVAAKDSSISEIKDLNDKTIYAALKDSKADKKARGVLSGKANVTYEETDSFMTAAEAVTGDGTAGKSAKCDVMLISDSNYKMACEELKGYKDKTKIVDTIKVQTDPGTKNGRNIDVTEDSYNIYISGIDFWGEINEVSRSDVNMIVTVNPKTRQILLTSIPRDSYVTLHSVQQLDKLTHSGVYGINETITTVEDWMGIEIDYYVRANFNMAMALVNAMDGVDVYSDYAFKSSVTDYKYKKGWNYMTGKEALYFARERKVFKDSDQQRIKNQQKVVKAMIRKATSSKVILTNYTKLLDAVEGYMQTNMSQAEIKALVRMQLDDMDKKWTISSISVKGHEEMRGTYSMGPGRPLTVNITDEDSVKRATRLINKVQYPEDNKPVKIKDDKSKKNNLKEKTDKGL